MLLVYIGCWLSECSPLHASSSSSSSSSCFPFLLSSFPLLPLPLSSSSTPHIQQEDCEFFVLLLREHRYTEFEAHLRQLGDLYSHAGPTPQDKVNFYLALSAMEKVLQRISESRWRSRWSSVLITIRFLGIEECKGRIKDGGMTGCWGLEVPFLKNKCLHPLKHCSLVFPIHPSHCLIPRPPALTCLWAR